MNFKSIMFASLSFFIMLMGTLSVTSCTKKASGGDYGLNPKETLRVNVHSEPPSLDWSKATDTTSGTLLDNLMEHLVNYDTKDPNLKLSPGLATKWSVSKDGKTWSLELRSDVKWTDGQPFVAQQVVDGWERLLNPATGSEYAYMLFDVVNAQDFNKGTIKDFTQVGIKALSDTTLEIKLKASKAYFPMLLTHTSSLPIRKDLIAKFGDKWTEASNLVTLGPYKLKIWDHDKALVLERNESYFGEKAKTKYVLAYMIQEQTTALNLFESGKLDVMDDLPSTELKQLRQKPEYSKESTLVINYYGFNVNKAPTNNPKVRRALAMAIDKQELVTLLDGGQTPLKSIIPPGMMGYEPEVGLSFSVEKSKALFKEAGFADLTKLPKVEISFNTNANHQRVAENIQAQLKKNLGIQVEIKNEEWKVYLNTLKTNPAPVFRMGWQADYPDPDNFINLFTSYSENNRTGWKNKKYDALVEKGASELNAAKRLDIYRQAQRLLLEEDAALVPLHSGVSHHLIHLRVQDFPVNVLNREEYKNVVLKK